MKLPHLAQLDFIAHALNSRTVREKQLIIGFLIAFAFTADYFLLLQPAGQVLSTCMPKIGPLREQLKELLEDDKNRDEISKKWEAAKADLTRRNQAFIAPDETPLLLENLSKDAQMSGVKIVSLEPSEGVKVGDKNFYSVLPIEIKAMAGTHEFGKFLSTLESEKTFFKVKDLRVAGGAQSDRKHQFTLSLEAFRREK